MKVIACILVLGIAAPAASQTAPSQAPDGVVTIRKKGSTWSFKVVPEGRKTIVVDGKEVEIDVPQTLHVAYAADEPHAEPIIGSNHATFTVTAENESRTAYLYREGKRYQGLLIDPTGEELNGIQKVLLEQFYQFDLDFPGGSWEELAKLLRDRLAAAYEQQFPEFLKPFLPAKVDIEISPDTAHHARYPAIQARSVTLALLRRFGPGPLVDGKNDSVPRVVEKGDKGIELVMDIRKSLSHHVLLDHNTLVELEVAFYNLGSKAGLPGADHVVALFELAWKARGGPLFAKVKYHPETKTLMVQGTSEELAAGDKVFATLTGNPAPVEPTANPFESINQHLQKIAELIKKQTETKEAKDK
jgi:hypothetical protein